MSAVRVGPAFSKSLVSSMCFSKLDRGAPYRIFLDRKKDTATRYTRRMLPSSLILLD